MKKGSTTQTATTLQVDEGRGQHARQHVAAELVGAERMRRSRALQRGGEVDLDRVPAHQPRAERAGEEQRGEHRQADLQVAIAGQALPPFRPGRAHQDSVRRGSTAT